MSRLAPIALAFLAACSGPPAEEPPPRETTLPAVVDAAVDEQTAFAERARVATSRLQLQLKQELSAAMEEGGPARAVEICSERAAAVTRELGEETNLEVRRVSVRNRNPANRATPGEASVLALMAARPALADTVMLRDGSPFYMRAIRVNSPLCLNCHGPLDELAPDVRAMIDALYEADAATGYREGDLRGAFVVRPRPSALH